MDTGHTQRDRQTIAESPQPGRRCWSDVPRNAQVATVSVVALFVLAVALLGWRWTRTLDPLPPSGLWLVSLALLTGGFLLGGLRIQQNLAAVPAVARWVFWMAWAAAGLLAIALSVPGTPPLALGSLWLVVGVLLVFLAQCPGVASLSPSAPTILPVDAPTATTASCGDDDREPLFDEGTLPEGVEQEIVRLNDAEVGTVIQGRLRVPFEPGQRSTSVHVAFCPPLGKIPSVAVEVLSGPSATAKVGASLVQGARFDVRLEQSSTEATAVTVAFFAQESSAETTEPGPPFHRP